MKYEKKGLFSAEASLRCAEPKAMKCATDCKTRKLRFEFRAVLESAEILEGDMYYSMYSKIPDCPQIFLINNVKKISNCDMLVVCIRFLYRIVS